MSSSSASPSSRLPPSNPLQVAALFLWCFSFYLFLSGAEAAAPAVQVGNISRAEDAQYFHIYYGQSFKVIKNSIDGKSYLLIQSNSRMASKTKYCTGRIKSFVIPLTNYSLDTATPGLPVSFFELLGLLEGLKGVTSDSVPSECVLRSLSDGNTVVVNRTDVQQLKQFMAHFVSNIDEERACNYAAFLPLEEVTPLQRAEWIKFLGTFANAEARANAVYDAVKSNYQCLSKMAANQTARFKPVVAWVEYNQGIWSFAKESYKQELVRDAGGENVDDSITNNSYNVSNPDDMDNFHAILCTVDVVIDQSNTPEPAEYTLSTFMENMDVSDNSFCVFLTNQSLWRYDKRVRTTPSGHAVDWFDGAISQPQLVLADLMEAFFPTGNYNTTYFRNLAKSFWSRCGVLAGGSDCGHRAGHVRPKQFCPLGAHRGAVPVSHLNWRALWRATWGMASQNKLFILFSSREIKPAGRMHVYVAVSTLVPCSGRLIWLVLNVLLLAPQGHTALPLLRLRPVTSFRIHFGL